SRDVAPAPGGVPRDHGSIAATLERLGVRPSRRLGQSFLADPFVADAEAALAAEGPAAPVVEIGGGLGVLTEALLRRGVGPLTVVERDPKLAAHLRASFADRIEVVEGDALEWTFPTRATVVGNLPFSAATPILLARWAARTPRLVVLVQREVAERIAAAPGSRVYGRLSIAAALYGTTELFQVVPSRSFEPVPEVEGRVLVHTARSGPLPVPSVAEFEAILRHLFSSRRKQLANLLPRIAGGPEAAARWATLADWPEDWRRLRPEVLPPEAYFRLATVARRRGARSPRASSASSG
ncbi:MAG: 16S rRNA (adenine(1518)-N(6)/adenine(1519)-N(6))-dimethyltransferase RsmA, partial [Thermoplasmata archaeon]